MSGRYRACLVMVLALAVQAGAVPAGEFSTCWITTNASDPTASGLDDRERDQSVKYKEIPSGPPGLEEVFGGPCDAGFGTAVFRQTITTCDALEGSGRLAYRVFVGETWNESWEQTWQKRAIRRMAEPVEALLATFDGTDPSGSASMLVDGSDDPTSAATALRRTFDEPPTQELAIYRIGDGAVMSGLVIAGCDPARNEAVTLVFLLD